MTPYEPQTGKPGHMMSFDFQESSGLKIKGIAFNDAINALDHQVAVGKVYAIIPKLKFRGDMGKLRQVITLASLCFTTTVRCYLVKSVFVNCVFHVSFF